MEPGDAAVAKPPSAEADDGAARREERPYTWSDMNLRQKTKHAVANITVEPITLMYLMPNVLSYLTTQNLNFEKACRINLNYSAELCDSFAARDPSNETEAQFNMVSGTVAEMQVWQSPLQSVIPIVLVLFAGSWSDRRRRRKPFILLPVFGDLLMVVGLLLCSLFFLSVPLEVAGVVEAVFPAMTGGFVILLMSVFSYVADVTTPETRTFRIGILHTAVAWGSPIASALSGVAFESLGFVGVYALDIAIYALALVYGVTRLREPAPPVARPAGVSFISDFCNWRHVWSTVKVALRRRAGSRRLQVGLVVLLYFAVQGPLLGEASVSYFYLTTQFRWGAIPQSAYGTYCIVLLAVGNFVVTTVFSRWLALHDCTIGVIAMAAKVLSAPLYAFASEDWQLYAVTATDILAIGSVITMRSIATKLVSMDEVGKLLAFLAVVEAVIPLVFKPVYSKVYALTSAVQPGLYFLVSGAVNLGGLALFVAIFVLQRREARVPDAAAAAGPAADGGVANVAFQGDADRADAADVRVKAAEAAGSDTANTVL